MSKHLANVTGNPQTHDFQLHQRTNPEPESPVSIVEPSTPQSKSNAQLGASPVAFATSQAMVFSRSPRRYKDPGLRGCRICGVRNSFANVCRKVKKTDLHAITEQDGESSDEESTNVEYVTSVTLVHDNIHQVSESNVSPFVKEIYSATINILPEKYVQGYNLKLTSKRLRMWNNSEVIPQGTTNYCQEPKK